MAGELDVGSIVMRIRADASGVQQGLKELEAAMAQAQGKTAQAGARMDQSYKQMGQSAQASAAAQAAAAGAMAAAAAKAFAVIVGAIDAGIKAMNRYQAALIGVNSVAKGQGISDEQMTQALNKVTDAFLDTASASTAFKNLLARGYDIEQATNAIIQLKDAAAFGRQASLGLAEAVVTATEGLKNENSILVDNAGVTKNVAKMWEDYAKSLGVATTALTQQQKIEAEVKGIMEETRYQVGDLAKLQDTLAGSQASAAMSAEKLAEAYGRSMSPAVEGLTRLWDAFLKGLTDIVNQFPGLIAGVSAAALAIGAFVVAQKAAAALQALNLALQAAAGGATIFGIAINTALPWLGALAALVGLVTMAWTNHARAEELAREQAEEQLRTEKERQGALQATATDLQKLGDRYNELSGKTNRTYAESEEMLRIEAQLKDQYGITGSSLRGLAGDYNTVTEAIRQKRAETLKELQESKDLATAAAKATYDDAQAKAAAAREYLSLGKRLGQAKADLQDLGDDDKTGSNYNTFLANAGKDLWKLIGDLEKAQRETVYKHGLQVDALEQYAEQAKTAAGDLARAYIDSATNAFEISGGKVDQDVKAMLDRLFVGLAEAPTKLQHTNVDAMVDAYTQALSGLSNADVGPAVRAMEEVNRKIVLGMEPKESDLSAIEKGWQSVLDFAKNVGESLGLDDSQIMAFATQLAPVMTSTAAGLDNVTAASRELFDLWKNQNLADFLVKEGQDLADAINETRKAVQGQVQVMDSLAQQYKGESDVISALRTMVEGFEAGNEKLVKASKDALVGLGYDAPESLELARQALDRRLAIQQAYQSDMGALYADMEAMRQRYKDQMKALEGEGRQDSAEYKSVKAFVAMIEEAQYRAGVAMRHGGLTGIGEDEAKKIDATTAAISDLQAELDKLQKNAEGNAEAIQALQEKIAALKIVQEGMTSGQTDSNRYQEALEYLQQFPEFANLALGGLEAVNGALGTQQAIMAASAAMLSGNMAEMQSLIDGLKTRMESMEDSGDRTILQGMIASMEQAMAVYQSMSSMPTSLPFAGAFDMTTASAEDLQKELDSSTASLIKLQNQLKENASHRAVVVEIKRVADAQKAGTASADEWAKAQADAAKVLGYTGDSAEDMADRAALALEGIDSTLAGLQPQVQNAMGWVQQLLSYIATNKASLNIDTGPASAALNGLISIWNSMANSFLGKLLGWKPVGSAGGGGGGGGGGGSKKDEGNSAFKAAIDSLEYQVSMGRKSLQGELNALLALQKKYKGLLNAEETRDLNKRIYDAQEAVRQANLQKDLDALEHKKSMGRLSLAAEVIALQKILKAHKLNAEERRDVLEQLYAAQEALRQERLNKELRRISYLTTVEKMTTAEEIKALEAVLAKHKLTTDERMDLEEQLFAARERLRSDALAWDLALLDHQVAMGKSNTQQEIARLEEIKTLHVLTTEEIMQIDERIYRLQNQRMQESVNKTKTAYDQIVSALKNRLSEQKRLEDAALDDRIDALNELTRAENEAVKTDDYARNLADKQRELSVEKSARRRRELMEEIAQMEAAETLRLTQLARQEEIDALKAQKDAVSERYAQLTSEENIRQEALRMVMSSNLQEMTDLIASYGNQWQDAGAQLAQALSDGLLGNSSTIMNTIQQLNEAIQTSINDQLSAMGRSIPNTLGTGGVVINMYGLTVRENEDIDGIASTLYDRIQAAGR